MEKIDFDKVYYHNIESMRAIKFRLIDKKAEEKLKSILETGYIYSRRNLWERNIKVEWNNFNFNGSDYISVCKKKGRYIKTSTAYDFYVKTGINLILSEKIKEDLEFKEYPRAIEGEEQVKDKIPISYICGLSFPIPNGLEEQCYQDVLYVKAILVKHGLEVPIFNVNKNNEEITFSNKEIKEMIKKNI